MSTQLNLNAACYYKRSTNKTKLSNIQTSNTEDAQLYTNLIPYQSSFNKDSPNSQNSFSISPCKRRRFDSANMSNASTAHNSNRQTPKTSFDMSNEVLNRNYEIPNLNQIIYEKLTNFSGRRYSEDASASNYYYNSNGGNSYYNSNSSKESDFKTKYKTELCKYFEINGTCKFGDNCAYAHGKENLRAKITKTTAYRTKNCIQFFENGFCPYGNRCQFAHLIKTNILNNPYEQNMSYSKILNLLNKPESILNVKKLETKNRLQVFSSIAKKDFNKIYNYNLFDDIKNLIKDPFYEKIQIDQNNYDKLNSLNSKKQIENAEEEENFKRIKNYIINSLEL